MIGSLILFTNKKMSFMVEFYIDSRKSLKELINGLFDNAKYFKIIQSFLWFFTFCKSQV